MRTKSIIKALYLGASLLAPAGLPAAASAQSEPMRLPPSQRDLAITIYNGNLAYFADTRVVTLDRGDNLLEIEGVSETLISESLFIEGSAFKVVEQSFRPKNLSPDALLRASVGKPVQVELPAEGDQDDLRILEGQLVSVQGGLLVRIGDSLRIVSADQVIFPSLPDGLDPQDLLVARLRAGEAGSGDAVIGYLAQGLSWGADYVLRLDAREEHLSLVAKATLDNGTEEDFEHAAVSLVAGEIARVRPEPQMIRKAQVEMLSADATMGIGAAMPQQETAGENHRYVLPARVDLPAGTVKQVPFLEAASVAVSKRYRVENLLRAQITPGDKLGPVNATIELLLQNDRAEGLGRPLPAGVWRVYGSSPNGGPLLLGEARQEHIPEDAEITLALGEVFDVTAEAVTSEYKRISNRSFEAEQDVTLKNAKDRAVTVELVGDYPPGTRVLQESQPHEVASATRFIWPLEVPAKGEVTLTYRVLVAY